MPFFLLHFIVGAVCIIPKGRRNLFLDLKDLQFVRMNSIHSITLRHEQLIHEINDNLEAARKIEGDASAKFGGRFNAIVSDAEFAYVNWYGKRNCQLRYENRHSLTWED